VSTQLACSSCHDPHGKYRRLQSGAVARTGAPIKASGSYDNVTANEPTAPRRSAPIGSWPATATRTVSAASSGILAFRSEGSRDPTTGPRRPNRPAWRTRCFHGAGPHDLEQLVRNVPSGDAQHWQYRPPGGPGARLHELQASITSM